MDARKIEVRSIEAIKFEARMILREAPKNENERFQALADEARLYYSAGFDRTGLDWNARENYLALASLIEAQITNNNIAAAWHQS